MENATSNQTVDYYDDTQAPTVLTLNFSSCAEYLALNLSAYDLVLTPVDLVKGNPVLLSDGCNHTVLNRTYVDAHPAKYAVIVTYPVLLFICTVGNILNLIVLGHEHHKKAGSAREDSGTIKRMYLMSLAFSDLCFMWSQFFPYMANYGSAMENNGLKLFINQIAGGCAFLEETFVSSSDWILIAFSAERCIAIVFPLKYSVLVSKKRTILTICGIFLASIIYGSFSLFDYYWFFYNYDPRCPPAMFEPPAPMKNWFPVQQLAVLIIPLVTFALIFGLNLTVTLQMAVHKKFRTLHAQTSSGSENGSNNAQAVRLLFACAFVYVCVQFPVCVFNILKFRQRPPTCSYVFTDEVQAVYDRVNSVAVNFNYSINFFLYYGVSSSFRQGLREILPVKKRIESIGQPLRITSWKNSGPMEKRAAHKCL